VTIQDIVLKGEAKSVSPDLDGVLRICGSMCVPRVGDWVHMKIEKDHCSKYSIHLGAAKMYYDLKQHYWWCGMKRDIVDFMGKCLNCQQVKYKHQRSGSTMQRMPIPEWKWERITMNFVINYPSLWVDLNLCGSLWIV